MVRTRVLLPLFSIWTLFLASTFGESMRSPSSRLPSAAESSVSAALGRDFPTYHAHAAGVGFEFGNPRHDLKVDFDSKGLQLQAGSDHWTLRFLGCGRGDVLEQASSVAPRSDLNRIEYLRGLTTEWYVNGPAGLEQGFTISKPPSGASNQPLTLALAFSGNIVVRNSGQDSLMLISSDSDRTASLGYTGLSAFDADGRELPAWQELRDGQLLLKVDDRSAHYPVVIDPWIQRAKLTASDGQSGDALGSSIAISGDTVVVGAPLATVNGNMSVGAVYVFKKPASGWKNMTQVAKLTASDGIGEDELGLAVDIQDDTIVAGAPVVGFNNKPGAVYVFVKPVGGWKDMTQTAELLPSDHGIDEVGWFVSISGDTVVGGAPTAGPNGLGLVYVFTKPASGWKKRMTETALLSASHGGGLSGWLSMDHNTVVTGGVTGDGKEAAFVYVKPAKGWKRRMTESATLEASDGQPQDLFGSSTYIEGETIVVGAPEAKIGSNIEQGAGYVFVKPATGWKGLIMQTAKLTSSDGQAQDQLGCAASISGNTLALGAVSAHVKGSQTGAVYVYVKPKVGWKNMTQKLKLFAKDGMALDAFGNAVSISGSTLAVGAPSATIHSQAKQGAAYVFQQVK